jgi:hypothetical protein
MKGTRLSAFFDSPLHVIDMNDISLKHLEVLDGAVASILKSHPDGLNEYDLIRTLSKEPYSLLSTQAFTDNLALFKTHFILFNALYRLQRFYHVNKIAHIDIVVTHIKLAPWSSNGVSVDADNKLYDYYSDWTHYESTSQQDVDDLIDSFWKKMGTKQSSTLVYSKEDIKEAWFMLELDENTTDRKQLKRRYHQLMHNHHPDKGGDTSYTQSLSEAYSLLINIL